LSEPQESLLVLEPVVNNEGDAGHRGWELQRLQSGGIARQADSMSNLCRWAIAGLIDWESGQARGIDIVPMWFDGVRNARQKIRRGCLFRHETDSRLEYASREMPTDRLIKVLVRDFVCESMILRIVKSRLLAPPRKITSHAFT
jgi:hypothetical protein